MEEKKEDAKKEKSKIVKHICECITWVTAMICLTTCALARGGACSDSFFKKTIDKTIEKTEVEKEVEDARLRKTF